MTTVQSVDEITKQLRRMADYQSERAEALTRSATEAREEAKRLKRALAVLDPAPNQADKKEKRKRKLYSPSKEHLDAILSMIQYGKPRQQGWTHAELSKQLRGQMSHDTVRRGLATLRERELIRIAGRNGNKAVIYKEA